MLIIKETMIKEINYWFTGDQGVAGQMGIPGPDGLDGEKGFQGKL